MSETPEKLRMTPHRRSLHQDKSGELVLSYYPAGHIMDEHAHDVDQSSMILAGALAEDTPSRTATPGASQVGFKAAGMRHANRYGPSGALILAFNARSQAGQGAPWRWTPTPAANQIGALLAASTGCSAISAGEATDLIALLSEPFEPARQEPPVWLSQVRDAVLEDPDGADVQALAEAAGVHRVHLSRAYSRHYQTPISLDRRRARMGLAVRALMETGATPAQAAYEAGFADQPHFARTLKQETGLTPRTLMRIFTQAGTPPEQVTPVQDRSATPPYRAAS
ncbi:AraC family transcriptional regulator [Oceanicaulis sp. MMSF_3324]|uniref:helix-turn-helix domain-containing protein n=1 Tax=Oceanicaulis sp. MMSF_3324 TaxID=3046702 RepID=UPI00273DF648|nr:AraC family transcriptional regulator [Oceanicaulis sp. MMSF_3324]